jgi:hypothetical protein
MQYSGGLLRLWEQARNLQSWSLKKFEDLRMHSQITVFIKGGNYADEKDTFMCCRDVFPIRIGGRVCWYEVDVEVREE